MTPHALQAATLNRLECPAGAEAGRERAAAVVTGAPAQRGWGRREEAMDAQGFSPSVHLAGSPGPQA